MLAQQGAELAALQDAEARTLLRLAQDARREMREALEAALSAKLDERTPYTVQHLRIMLAQAESVVSNLTRRMNAELDTMAGKVGERALSDLLAVIRKNEPDFIDAAGKVELRALRRLTETRGLLVHTYSTQLYSASVMDAIQRDLALGLMRGDTRAKVVARIVKSGAGTMAEKEHRAELIARMETNRAYGEMHHASNEEAAAELDEPGRTDPLIRQMDEYFDYRNSPFSRACNGIVAALDQPWRVPVAEVQKWEKALKRRAGIVKQVLNVGGYYEVHRYPAHFSERGRSVPYRASWDGGAALAKMDAAQRKGIPDWKP